MMDQTKRSGPCFESLAQVLPALHVVCMQLAVALLCCAAGKHMITFGHWEMSYSNCLLTADKRYARSIMPYKSANIGLPPLPLLLQRFSSRLKLLEVATGNAQVDLLLSAATAEGFSGGLYVGFPHKGLAKKYFLCLCKGRSPACEGQMWSQACPLALPFQCELSSAPCHLQTFTALLRHVQGAVLSQLSCAAPPLCRRKVSIYHRRCTKLKLRDPDSQNTTLSIFLQEGASRFWSCVHIVFGFNRVNNSRLVPLIQTVLLAGWRHILDVQCFLTSTTPLVLLHRCTQQHV